MVVMATKKQDAENAFALLRQYHAKLAETGDASVVDGLGKLIDTFGRELVDALFNIQEHYEMTLRESYKDPGTDYIPYWEHNRFINENVLNASGSQANNNSNEKMRYHTERRFSTENSFIAPSDGQTSQVRFAGNPPLHNHQQPALNTYPVSDDTINSNCEYLDIVLERGLSGLGFSIAGGKDNPVDSNDFSIFITKIIPNGAAAHDGRLHVNDVILSVNGINTKDVCHIDAVHALKLAGTTVRLEIKRFLTPNMFDGHSNGESKMSHFHTGNQTDIFAKRTQLVDFHLSKGLKGMGFSIAGGIGNQHIIGDNGIYVTKIIEGGAAEADGTLKVSDKIISVDGTPLVDVTHESAVAVLKQTSNVVQLCVERQEDNMECESYLVDNNFCMSNNQGISSISPPLPTPPPENAYSGDSQDACQSPVNFKDDDDALPPMMKQKTYPQYSGNTLSTILPHLDTENNLDSESTPFDSGTDSTPNDPRVINLHKNTGGLGFNIVGGDENEGIFISYIMPGGTADLSGELQRGDQILSVNGIDLASASHDEAASALKGAETTVTIVAQYRPIDYQKFEEKIQEMREQMMNMSVSSGGSLMTSQKRHLYVRAMFDYDASRDSGLPSKGLSFHYGDILHVINASDNEWWQARRVLLLEGGKDSSEFGVIPGKHRVERKERARLKQVKFSNNNALTADTKDISTGGKRRKNTFSRRFPFYKSKENLIDDISDPESNVAPSDRSDSDNTSTKEELIVSYETVVQKELKYTRPLIILGPFKDRINDDLLSEYPERFGSCVPHTTREPRETEEDGRDYHFVSSREQMEADIQNHFFIEAGQYNGNLYGTSVQSVKDVAHLKKHCILDVSGNAIKRLQAAGIWPIAILIRPYSIQWLMEMNKRLVEEQARKIYDRVVKIEQEFGEYLTAVVQGENLDHLYEQIKQVIKNQSGSYVWVPVAD